ncbi:MAG TPA: hypothetical protein PLX41_12000 [Bacteroidales bacterium]|nr:hypothetical protein [Bacteroidales bacterium]
MTDSISNTLAINYTTLIPVLIEAIKEQEEQIADLRKETEALKELLNQKE